MSPLVDEDAAAIGRVTEKYNADLLLYAGPIFRGQDDILIDMCRRRKRRPNVLLYLTTPGGDAHAAYRVSRCLQRSYRTYLEDIGERGKFSIYVHTLCKSAGTLLALGADELILAQTAELGPIDVQLRKTEEVGERISGLTPVQALQTLETQARGLFKRSFRQMRFDGQLSFPTRLAAEMAVKMTVGLMEPIYGQVDPMRLGEVERFVKIAYEYGERLATSNVKDKIIEQIITGYPSHEFVIDRREARELFENIAKPSDDLESIANTLSSEVNKVVWGNEPLIRFLSEELPTEGVAKDVADAPKAIKRKGRRRARAAN